MKEWIIGIIIFAFIMAYFYNPNFFSQIKEKFTEITTTEKISISEIVKNPQNYVNKTVTVIGRSDFDVTSLIDEQGYTIYLDGCKEPGRILLAGTYKAKGTIYETCECEWRDVFNITKEEWESHPELEEIIKTYGKPYLILPSPDEGWMPPILPAPRVEVLKCKTEVLNKNYTYTIWKFPYGNVPIFSTEVLREQRCRSNTIRVHLKCTEPLIKIS
jgi:hypothetical protein